MNYVSQKNKTNKQQQKNPKQVQGKQRLLISCHTQQVSVYILSY